MRARFTAGAKTFQSDLLFLASNASLVPRKKLPPASIVLISRKRHFILNRYSGAQE